METPLEGPQAVSVSGGGALAGKAAVCSAVRRGAPRCAETGRRFAAMRSAEVRSACNRPKSKEAGFSITGVLVSSSIGLIVLTGTMQTLVNISHRLSVQEARLKQPLLHSYLIERFAKTGRCTKTLEGLKITENAAVTLDSGVKEYWANPTTAPRQHVASLKDAAGTVLRDLHSAQTQKDFKRDFDIDKFARLIFRGFHPEGDSGTPAVDFDDPGDTEEGRARLEAFVMDKGMFRKPIIVQLRGVKLKKDGHGTGIHKITACHSVDSIADVSAEITELKRQVADLKTQLDGLGLSVVGNDLISAKAFLTAGGKSIKSGGLLVSTGGGLRLDMGGNITTGGNITAGNITADRNLKVKGKIEARRDIFTTRGNIYTTGSSGMGGGRIYTANGGIRAGGGGIISTQSGSIVAGGTGAIYTANGHIEAGGTGNIRATNGNIITDNGNFYTLGNGYFYTNGGYFQTRTGNVWAGNKSLKNHSH